MILVLNQADGNFLFRMGEATAAILDPKSAAGGDQPSAPGSVPLRGLEEDALHHAGEPRIT